jgi:hypothetical protein
MPDALELLENIEALDIPTIARQTIVENKEVISDLIATQMSQGLRSDGTDILPDYAPLTIELKKGKQGLAGVTDRVTLFDTGEHFKELYVEVKGDEMDYGSKVPYAEDLEEKYDTAKGSIHKMTEESQEELVNGYLENDFYSRINEATGL